MASVDDLTELVETAGAAEKVALAAKWHDQSAVAATAGKLRRRADQQRETISRDVDPARLSPHWAALRHSCLALGSQPGLPGQDSTVAAGPLSHQAAAQAERDAEAGVALARMMLLDAGLAVVQARLARIRAGEGGETTARGHADDPAHTGTNTVSRHGPALAHGISGEIRYVLARKPRSTVKSLAVSLAMGLLYLGFIRAFQWDAKEHLLPYLGLWVISVVMGGQVCINAMSFDAIRVRAALESGERLWQILVVKNLALLCIVAPLGFLLSAVLAWQAADAGALVKACVLVTCFVLLWLGVGNILSIGVPTRDEPLRRRRQTGSLKQFVIALVVSYVAGYLVNGALLWRVYAARALTEKLGSAWVPGVLILLSCLVTWVLFTVLATALAQQPRVRRTLQREIADYQNEAEARALAADRRGLSRRSRVRE